MFHQTCHNALCLDLLQVSVLWCPPCCSSMLVVLSALLALLQKVLCPNMTLGRFFFNLGASSAHWRSSCCPCEQRSSALRGSTHVLNEPPLFAGQHTTQLLWNDHKQNHRTNWCKVQKKEHHNLHQTLRQAVPCCLAVPCCTSFNPGSTSAMPNDVNQDMFFLACL